MLAMYRNGQAFGFGDDAVDPVVADNTTDTGLGPDGTPYTLTTQQQADQGTAAEASSLLNPFMQIVAPGAKLNAQGQLVAITPWYKTTGGMVGIGAGAAAVLGGLIFAVTR